ncbi:MAG: trp operon repressor [Deltaproteobacteria bacterium CG11_big_fil_rev_8_21_14_0_20_49_13]|nr:MAG: trp operon repressor [Deltaproteobacteria bacterium CG11_big_fil_rev_8_21_14_0_20_49_13]
MEDGWRKELIELFASAKTKVEIKELLSVLLTPKEYEELAKRWQIVKRLIEGVPQREIKKELGASIATVTRGSREIQYGNGTFQKFYKRLEVRQTR